MSRTKVRFGDVVRKVNKKIDPIASGVERYVAGEHMDTDEPRILRFGNVGDGYLGPAFHMLFEPGHILYGSRRTYLRKVAMADFSGVCANTTFVLEPSTENLDSRYLLYVMSTERFHQNSISLSKGSTNPYINFSDLASYEFELPSLNEQARLVELVSAIEECVESTRRMRDVVRVLRQLLLSGEVRAQGTQYPLVQLRDLVEVLDHMRRPISSDERAGRVGAIPYYGATGRTGWIDDHLFDEDLVLLGEDAVDFMNPTCEKAYFVSGKSWVNNHAHVLRPVIHVVDAKYLVAALNQVDYTKFASFGTRSKLTKSAMMEIELAVPDLQVQKSIVAKLDGFDTALKSLDESVDCARNLQLSILNSELS